MIAILADLPLKATTLLVLAATATALMRAGIGGVTAPGLDRDVRCRAAAARSRDSRSRQSGWPSWLQKPRSQSSPRRRQ